MTSSEGISIRNKRGQFDTSVVDGQKRCSKCGEKKPLPFFYTTSRGSYWVCKECQKEYRKQQYRKHRKFENASTRKWVAQNKDRVRDRERRRTLKRYNLTPESHQVLLNSQAGKCAICENIPKEGENLHVDHDHRCCSSPKNSCGKCVRALLCDRCNLLLGILEENLALTAAVAAYIQKHQ